MALNLTIKQLKYAEAAGRLGSIAAASAEHNISQSSVTAAIDAMEAALGYDLFIRQPAKGILPTPSGEKALKMIADILRQHSHFEAELEALGGAPRGVLRLGCYATVAPGFLPRVLSGFSQDYPDAQTEIAEGDMASMIDLLRQGEIDLACTYLPDQPSDLEFRPLFKAPPYALVPESDPLAAQRAVTLAELAERPFIMLDLPMTRDYFGGMFRRAGVSPRIAHSTRSSEIVRSLVAGDFGVSILNIRHRSDKGYRALPISDEIMTHAFGVAMMRGVRPPLMSRMLIEQLERMRQENAFADLVIDPV